MRADLGRLAPGGKADIVLVDLACPQMQPDRDPLKALIYHAADRAVRDVFVDGRPVVVDRRVVTLDQQAAGGRLRIAWLLIAWLLISDAAEVLLDGRAVVGRKILA